MRKLFAAAVLTLAAYSQVRQSGPQVFTYLSDVDDTDQPYSLYLPGGYDNSKKWPLVISLHGEGSNHRLNLRRLFGRGNRLGETDAEASRYFPAVKDVDFIVASPFARGTMGYQGIAERDVYAVLEQVRDKFNIDEDRIYLTGLSMGGGGALWLGLTRPDIWAAIAPVCPYHPPAETAELAGNALNVPVKMFQGAFDPLVKAETVRLWQKRFVDARVRSDYVEYPTVRHNAWDTAYRDGAIFDWFKQFRRVRYPHRVQFAARDYAHASAYWVRFDAMTPGTIARIDANFTASNAVTITTTDLDGFTLQLKGHPMAVRARRLAVTIDGANLRARVADSVSFVKTAKGWSAARPDQPAGNKRAGAEGPLAEAVSSRHMYVYGTADGAPPEEIARRLAVAKQAADWAAPRWRLTFTPRVIADAEVKAEDLKTSSLIVFGTRATNSLIAKLAPRLPLALNPGAADYSLTYIFPIDGRYVLINSGLPWWTRADQTTRGGMPFLGTPMRTLHTFGDFILFRGGLDNVIAEGRFGNAWNVPEDIAKRMIATGAVEVRQP